MNEKANKKWFCYKITNLINSKIYIGKTDNLRERFTEHKRIARVQPSGKTYYIHLAIAKYGYENFIIEQIGEYTTETDAYAAETIFIKEYGSRDKKNRI